MHDLDVLKKLNKTPQSGDFFKSFRSGQRAGETKEEYLARLKEYDAKHEKPVKEDVQFDEKNPAKTLASLAKIPEFKAQKFMNSLPLTDYVAVVNTMNDKDWAKLTAIVKKNHLKDHEYHEAIDTKVAGELRKIAMNSPHQEIAQQTSQTTANAVSGNNTTPITTTGTYKMTNPPPSAGAATPTTANAADIVSADSKSGTIAVRNPQTNKIDIKSVKDPKDEPGILDLIKNMGL